MQQGAVKLLVGASQRGRSPVVLSIMPLKIKRKFKSGAGFSLVETMIAVLLISVVVTSVFSLALTAKVTSVNTDRRSAALLAIAQAREKLKAYVTADQNITNRPNANWRLKEDITGSGYALSPGEHDVTLLLPDKYRNDPDRPMTLTYTVTDVGEGQKVEFRAYWPPVP